MIEGASILLVGFLLGYWMGRANKKIPIKWEKAKVWLGNNAEIVEMEDPLDKVEI